MALGFEDWDALDIPVAWEIVLVTAVVFPSVAEFP